jgi:hypothetical protein
MDRSTSVQPEPAPDPGLAALSARLDDQQAEIDRLRHEVASLRAATPSTPSGPPVGGLDAPVDRPGAGTVGLARRDLLRRAGTVAAGAVAGGAAASLAQASPAAAAQGSFNGDPAVTGTGQGGDGVVGTTDTAAKSGVYGYANLATAVGITARNFATGGVGLEAYAGTGVFGVGLRGFADGTGVLGSGGKVGVQGFSDSGFGVVAFGGSSGPGAPLALVSAGTGPRGRTSYHQAGELLPDSGENLWYCVVSGTPGTWRKLAGPATAGAFHPLASPLRVYDSRPTDPPATGIKAPLVGGSVRSVNPNTAGTIFGGSSALMVNLTVVNTSANGFLSIFKNGVPWPGTSNLNWKAPASVASNLAVSACDAAGYVALYAAPGSQTDVIVDVVGYWT